MGLVQVERASQPVQRGVFIPQPVRRVAQTRGSLGGRGVELHGDLEEPPGVPQHALPKERAPDLQHEIVILTKAEGQHPVETLQRLAALAELEERFPQPRESFLVIRVECECPLESLPGPGVLLYGELRIREPNVQLWSVGIRRDACSQLCNGQLVEALHVPHSRPS